MPEALGWREGHRLLAERIASLPEALRAAARPLPPLDLPPCRVRRLVTTGLGSSAAHARFLARVLYDAGIDARFRAISEIRERRRPSDEVLIVFSQGLAPNARLAFTSLETFRAAVLLTAVAPDGRAREEEEKRKFLDRLRRAGVRLVPLVGAAEYGILVRVVGPMTAYATALRLAEALGAPSFGLDMDRLASRVAQAAERLECEHPSLDANALEANLSCLAGGGYAECIDNLRLKVLEGMFLPLPPIWDPLEVAHGPLQQAFAGRATFLAFERAGDAREGELLDRLARILSPARHRLVRLVAYETGPLAVFEHEALMNALLLRFIEQREVDQVDWPGKGQDGSLYDVGDALAPSLPRGDHPGSLEVLTWPDVEQRLREGHDTAVLPLGSTEQHGPHLPLATDTWIAEALATRFCARFPEAMPLPVLPFGCAREHMAFPGTLSLEEATLTSLLRDIARSVAAHGFARLVVLSAHGGNEAALDAALPLLEKECPGLRIIAIGLAGISPALYAASSREGVESEAAGRHAGELETSILLALAPAATRRERFSAGLLDVARPSGEIFYPDLRAHAPDGTVGDPRGADASRAEHYLDAWMDAIAEHYLREKNRK